MLESGHREESLQWFGRAIVLRPGLVEARSELGHALSGLGRHEEALKAFEGLATLIPDDAGTCHNVGRTLHAAGRPADAVRWLRKAFALRPTEPAFAVDLGITLRQLGQADDAINAFRQALALQPTATAAASGLGGLLNERREFREAASMFRQVVEAEPNDIAAWLNLAGALCSFRAYADSLTAFRRALVLQPGSAVSYCNMALALFGIGRLEEAVEACDKALAIEPASSVAHFNRGCLCLALGRFQEGWEGYAHRFNIGGNNWLLDDAKAAPWMGEDLKGKSILVIGEQGNGDHIQFCRYAAQLAELGGQVTYMGGARLHRLLSSMPGNVRMIEALPPNAKFDFQVALMSIPRYTEARGLPVPTGPYLFAESDGASRWRERIGMHGFRIGVFWQGHIYPNGDARRAFPPEALRPVARLPGVRLISLQFGDGAKLLQTLPADVPIETLGDDFDAGDHAFLDSAAVMQSLDLVIACDTGLAHLAGALGRPLWIPLTFDPEWRWGRSGAATRWYPTARLFRQSSEGDWDQVFAAMAEAVVQMLPEAHTSVAVPAVSAPPAIELSWGDLFDKLSILEIKAERLINPEAAANVREEMHYMRSQLAGNGGLPFEVASARSHLRSVNEMLWETEDSIRRCEAEGRFDEEFVRLARSVYQWNDRRAKLKRTINLAMNSRFIEEKEYVAYSPAAAGSGLSD